MLSDLPVMPHSVLQTGLGGLNVTHVVFSDVHIGLNGNMGHFATGYESQGLSIEQQRMLPVNAVQSKRLQALQQDIFSTLHVPLKGVRRLKETDEMGKEKFRIALIVERAASTAALSSASGTAGTSANIVSGNISTKPSRHVANLQEVVSAALTELCPSGHVEAQEGQKNNRLNGYIARCVPPSSHSQHEEVWELHVVVLEDMLHSTQRSMFANADILIAAAGTALHNT